MTRKCWFSDKPLFEKPLIYTFQKKNILFFIFFTVFFVKASYKLWDQFPLGPVKSIVDLSMEDHLQKLVSSTVY